MKNSTLSNKIQYFSLRLGVLLIWLTPIRLLWLLGESAGLIAWIILPKYRHLVARNLRIVWEHPIEKKELSALVRKNFTLFGANMICAAKIFSMSAKKVRKFFTIEGKENLDPLQGGIVLFPHMSNWELMARIRHEFNEFPSYGSLYRSMPNPLVDDYVLKKREADGAEMYAKSKGFRTMIRRLREGGLMGMLADQHTGSEGIMVPWFGKLASSTSLPAVLHQRTGAPVHILTIETIAPARWKFRISPAIDLSDCQHDVIAMTTKINFHYSNWMRHSLLDGFWLHNRWKMLREIIPTDLVKKGDYSSSLIKHPLRGLILLPENMDWSLLSRLQNARRDLSLTFVGSDQNKNFLPKNSSFISLQENWITASLQADESQQTGFDFILVLNSDPNQILKLKKTHLGYLPFFGMISHPYSKQFRFRYKANDLNELFKLMKIPD